MNRQILKHFETYGPVVRIAPDELAFAKAQAWKDIYGVLPDRTQNPKDLNVWPPRQEGWDKALPLANDAVHARLRRTLGPAFTARAVREQEPVLARCTGLLISRLKEASQKDPRQDICKWLNFFTFDIVGELGFGKSFDCLENATYHAWVEAVVEGLSLGVLASQLNRYGIISAVEALAPKRYSNKLHAINDYVASVVNQRIAQGFRPQKPDIFNHILRAQDHNNLSVAEMQVNGLYIVLGGSETTASLLSGAIWFLCQDSRVLEKAEREIRGHFANGGLMTVEATTKMSYLRAILQEALRMFPPAPEGAPRIIGSQYGQSVAGNWIPRGVGLVAAHSRRIVTKTSQASCAVHQWAANNYSGNFIRAGEFLPERWLNQDEAFANDCFVRPFSWGLRNCIGVK